MIKNLQLRFGSNPTAAPLNFDPGSVTVFVGPNNSGKSLILREVETFTKSTPHNRAATHIISNIELEAITIDDIKKFVNEHNPQLNIDNLDAEYTINIYRENISISNNMGRSSVGLQVKDLASGSAVKNETVKEAFIGSSLIRIDGSRRLEITRPANRGDMKRPPQNLLDNLLINKSATREIRRIIFDAFKLYFLIDITGGPQLSITLSSEEPAGQELSLDADGIAFHTNATPIEDFSDGIKAFTGIVASIFGGAGKIILIDEPEAFLHPPLARKLGSIVSKRAAEQKGHIFASTHSSDFLLGCVQSGSAVNVVRLTYDKGKGIASARLLPSAKLQTMMRDPLLRSTGVLAGLFHQGVIVCEGDIDRVLYEEVNDRLINEKQGTDDVLFVNSIGKQTVHRIVKPLREVGIPTVAIVDLDIIKEGDLGALLRAAFVPDVLIQSWNDLKSKTNGEFKKLGKDPKKFGISILPDEAQVVAQSLIAYAAEYGVFIVPVGEVERWLDYIGATGEKTPWLVRVLELLGSDPKAQDYVKPRSDNVWGFINQIAKWLSDPERKGMPKD